MGNKLLPCQISLDMDMIMLAQLVGWVVVGLMVMVIVYGFVYFDEFEIGIEFLPKGYNNFELGVSNRNYVMTDDSQQQELRIGVLLFTFIFVFTKYDA